MSKQGSVDAPAGSGEDSDTTSREVAEAYRGNVTIADVDTASMASGLRDLFDRVMSGKPYDQDQVKSATNLSNTIVKVLRFEFEVFKHFAQSAPGRPGRPSSVAATILEVASWMRDHGDKVEKGAGPGLWVINGRSCEEKDLITRANNMRAQGGERPFK
jgi:hypothetical protein